MSRSARIPPLAWAFALLIGLLVFGFGLRLRSAPAPEPAPAGSTLAASVDREPADRPDATGTRGDVELVASRPVDVEGGETEPTGEVRGTIALVIDDVGRRVDRIDRFAGLGVPITFAVLPFETRTAEVVQRVAELGAEMLVHLPMEGSAGADPGPGALMATMDRDTLRARTRSALEAVPGAMGVNNHMGSVLSADADRMAAVLEEVAARGLFFLDSRTSAQSVGYRLARELSLDAAERDVFLDTERQVSAIDRQFDELLARASAQGSAIAIGHPYDETLEVLVRRVAEAEAAGYRFVPVSYLLERTSAPES